MRFEVPQFIGVEDKIFGPLTIKQFVYLTGAGALAFIAYHYLPFIFAVIIDLPLIALGLALAFYKVNNKPFIFVLEAMFKYSIGSRLYVWQKKEKPITARTEKDDDRGALLSVPKLSQSKLKDMTWTLDTSGASLGAKESMQEEKKKIPPLAI